MIARARSQTDAPTASRPSRRFLNRVLTADNRALAAVWFTTGSAVAALLGFVWYVMWRDGSAIGGDLVGHAATAKWLRTLPWWDWRGWSEWFYGGQAIGVNYPPLGHAWMRLTHPHHGQMAAVAIGLLVLLPWAVVRLTRAVGGNPYVQRVAVGAVMVLVASAGGLHWVLSGFHPYFTLYGSWPAMVSSVLCLFVAGWAVKCENPTAGGLVLGVALLFNASPIPGAVAVCAVLWATADTAWPKKFRWALVASCFCMASAAWWLVPFLSGWGERLQRWDVVLGRSLAIGGPWQMVVLLVVFVMAALAARTGDKRWQRLGMAALAGVTASAVAALSGWLRPERWLMVPLLVAVVAASGLISARRFPPARRAVSRAWDVGGVLLAGVIATATLRFELIPLAAFVMGRSRRTWAWAGAIAWCAALFWGVGLYVQIHEPRPSEGRPMGAVLEREGTDASGLVFLDKRYVSNAAVDSGCEWGPSKWATPTANGHNLVPLAGLYRETSPVAEFLDAGLFLAGGTVFVEGDWGIRPNWGNVWEARGTPDVGTLSAAHTFGARYYVECAPDGSVLVTDLPGERIAGVTVRTFQDDDSWHRAATGWWIDAATGDLLDVVASDVPILSRQQDHNLTDYPFQQAASGLTVATAQDSMTVWASNSGWAWVRVPWDRDWRATTGTPVTKGGPGHLVIWAEAGTTELRWGVPVLVDLIALGVTITSLLIAGIAMFVGRSKRRARSSL